MPNPNRVIDKTHLSIDQAEERGFIHRDYIAHCFRWSHVVKYLMQKHRYKTEIILDIGCGKDLPLPRLMYANKMTDFAYIGVDMNHLEMPEMLATAVKNGKADVVLKGNTNAAKFTNKDHPFEAPTVAVCFEVLEHVHPTICRELVSNVYNLLAPGASFFVSTPVWNGSAAANHIHEMKRETVGTLLEECGFSIFRNYGTFASQSDIYLAVDKNWPGIFEELNRYYDSNVLSVIFAPAFPEHSRNNLWHAIKKIPRNQPEHLDPHTLIKDHSPISQHPEAEKLFL